MKNTVKLVLGMVIGLSGLALNGISSEAIEVDAAGCQVVLVNDIHIDKKVNKRGPVQRKMILDNLVRWNQEAQAAQKQPALLIVEDMLNYDGPHPLVKENCEKESLQVKAFVKSQPLVVWDEKAAKNDPIEPVVSVIGNLTRYARDLGIECYNAECRQLKRVSRGVDSVKCADVAQEFDYNTQLIMQELAQLKREAGNDPVAQAVYEECLKIMELGAAGAQDTIELLRRTPYSLRELAANNDIEFAAAYQPLHDLHLVDARMLLEWYKNRSRDMIVMVAGENHTENVLKVFEKLGYKITRHGTKFPFDDEGLELSMNNCLDFDVVFNDLQKPHSNNNPWQIAQTAFDTIVDTFKKLVA